MPSPLLVGSSRPRLLRGVLEGAVAEVAEQERRVALVALGRAVGLGLAVQGAVDVLLELPLHVIGHEQVETPVLVVVEPRRAGGESGSPDACLLRDVAEGALAGVVEQAIAAERRDEQVDGAVVVVVAGRGAHAVHLDGEPGGARDVGEPSATRVAVERGQAARRRPPGPRLAVGEEQVLQPVVVDVEHDDARAHRLGEVLLPERATGVPERHARLRRDVGERDRR